MRTWVWVAVPDGEGSGPVTTRIMNVDVVCPGVTSGNDVSETPVGEYSLLGGITPNEMQYLHCG
jgi:hypothetical protein